MGPLIVFTSIPFTSKGRTIANGQKSGAYQSTRASLIPKSARPNRAKQNDLSLDCPSDDAGRQASDIVALPLLSLDDLGPFDSREVI